MCNLQTRWWQADGLHVWLTGISGCDSHHTERGSHEYLAQQLCPRREYLQICVTTKEKSQYIILWLFSCCDINDIQQLIKKPSQGKKKCYYLKWCDLAMFWFDLMIQFTLIHISLPKFTHKCISRICISRSTSFSLNLNYYEYMWFIFSPDKWTATTRKKLCQLNVPSTLNIFKIKLTVIMNAWH